MEHKPKSKILPTVPETTSGVPSLAEDISEDEKSNIKDVAIQVGGEIRDKEGSSIIIRNAAITNVT